MEKELATFGAGCFWGVEAEFGKLDGVLETAVGYAGGHTENPTYQEVCTDETGHAEVVQVAYDPARIPFAKLLATFWENHDPTTLNRQGPDVGSQYRSVIFFHTPAQKTEAEAAIRDLEAKRAFPRPIVTQVLPAPQFYRAEEYHQRYLEKRGQGSCRI